LKSVTALPDYKLWAVFSDGTAGEASLASLLSVAGYENLKDPDFFASFKLRDGAVHLIVTLKYCHGATSYGTTKNVTGGTSTSIYLHIFLNRQFLFSIEILSPFKLKQYSQAILRKTYTIGAN